VTNSDKPAR